MRLPLAKSWATSPATSPEPAGVVRDSLKHAQPEEAKPRRQGQPVLAIERRVPAKVSEDLADGDRRRLEAIPRMGTCALRGATIEERHDGEHAIMGDRHGTNLRCRSLSILRPSMRSPPRHLPRGDGYCRYRHHGHAYGRAHARNRGNASEHFARLAAVLIAHQPGRFFWRHWWHVCLKHDR